MSTRSAFLDFVPASRQVLARPEVRAAWDEPSSLEHMTVGMVAGHLLRALITLDRYVGGDEPELADNLVDAAGYLLSTEDLVTDEQPDLDSPLHQEIRQRSRDAASVGHEGVVARWDETASRLSARLASEPPARRIVVMGPLVMLVDEYITTRLIELVVHTDDLAVSVGLEPPDIPDAVYRPIASALVNAAHRRHGALAVIRALTRRERDPIDALRVL